MIWIEWGERLGRKLGWTIGNLIGPPMVRILYWIAQRSPSFRRRLEGWVAAPVPSDPDAPRTLEQIAAEEVCPYDGALLRAATVAEQAVDGFPFRCMKCGRSIT